MKLTQKYQGAFQWPFEVLPAHSATFDDDNVHFSPFGFDANPGEWSQSLD